MYIWRRVVATGIIFGLASCSGYAPTALPGSSFSENARTAAFASPADHPTALPGDHPTALPGATLSCPGTFEADQANCSIAVNVNIPPVTSATTPADLVPGLHPLDLASRYNFPTSNAGGTVAIVDAYDDPTAEADLAVYRNTFGLPACSALTGCFTKIDEHGGTTYPLANPGWAQEISLDLDMVSAVCPKCKILLVEAASSSFDDLGTAVDTAAAHTGVLAVSNSYYGPEWPGETAYDTHYNHPDVAITASSGDQRSPFYPAASPYVTTVGGTTLSGGPGSWTENVWRFDGAGCSQYEAKPAFQNKTGCTTRSMVDVSVVADPATGVSSYDSAAGGWFVVGGTSVGAPVVAAAYALTGKPHGPSYSYAHPRKFFDLNLPYYDRPTGLGSPSGLGGL